MAQHKAPTAVTVAPRSEATPFQAWVAKYWLAGLVLLIAAGAAVLFSQYRKKQAQVARVSTWSRLSTILEPNPFTQMPGGQPELLARLGDELPADPTGGWARLVEARSRYAAGDVSGARSAIEKLKQQNPKHPALALPAEQEGLTLADAFLSALDKNETWKTSHAAILANPPPPADAPTVTLTTDQGVIEVQLYTDKAPAHCANFLKLVQEKFYDGTRFHRVDPRMMIQGGDPNSKTDATSTWGQGGPGYTIPLEHAELYHFEGVLAAAKKQGDTESSGSQFYLTVKAAHHLDGDYTIFGKVTSGMDVVQRIAATELAEGSQDRPAVPAVLTTATVKP
ncbi:MAG: peptidylprolyl isomerase [Planctomycetes bacterium]|nr:peptidylprolyl isomerase [Planctomycetota bacterium]